MFTEDKKSSLFQLSIDDEENKSAITWTLDVMNKYEVAQYTVEINTILSKPEFNKISYGTSGAISGGPMEQLLRAIAPNCTQFIMQCSVGKATMNGWDCCKNYFDPVSVL